MDDTVGMPRRRDKGPVCRAYSGEAADHIPECSIMLSLEPVFGMCVLGCYRNMAGSVGRTCSLLQYHSETKEMQLFLVSGH